MEGLHLYQLGGCIFREAFLRTLCCCTAKYNVILLVASLKCKFWTGENTSRCNLVLSNIIMDFVPLGRYWILFKLNDLPLRNLSVPSSKNTFLEFWTFELRHSLVIFVWKNKNFSISDLAICSNVVFSRQAIFSSREARCIWVYVISHFGGLSQSDGGKNQIEVHFPEI